MAADFSDFDLALLLEAVSRRVAFLDFGRAAKRALRVLAGFLGMAVLCPGGPRAANVIPISHFCGGGARSLSRIAG